MIKKKLSKQLENRFNTMFANIQQKESDILAIGQLLKDQLPREELKQWRSKYYNPFLMMTLINMYSVEDRFFINNPKLIIRSSLLLRLVGTHYLLGNSWLLERQTVFTQSEEKGYLSSLILSTFCIKFNSSLFI